MIYLDLINDPKFVIINKGGAFSADTLREINEKTIAVDSFLCDEFRTIEVWFRMNEKKGCFSARFGMELQTFLKSTRYTKKQKFNFDRLMGNEVSLAKILSGIMGHSVGILLMNKKRIAIFAETLQMYDAIHRNLPLFKFAINSIFFRVSSVEITIEKCFDMFAPRKRKLFLF